MTEIAALAVGSDDAVERVIGTLQSLLAEMATVIIMRSNLSSVSNLLDDYNFSFVFLVINSSPTPEELRFVKSIRRTNWKNQTTIIIVIIPENCTEDFTSLGVDIILTEPLTQEKVKSVAQYCQITDGKQKLERFKAMKLVKETQLKDHSSTINEAEHNVTVTRSSEPQKDKVSCELDSSVLQTSKLIAKKRSVDALVHSTKERMRRERIKACCVQLQALLPHVKGRQTDVASILEMTVEYIRYICERIPKPMVSEMTEIFRANKKYCKYLWKTENHRYPQKPLPCGNVLTNRSNNFMRDSSRKVPERFQIDPFATVGNEHLGMRKHCKPVENAVSHGVESQKSTFDSNCSNSTTGRLMPQFLTNIPHPNILTLSLFSMQHSQNNYLPNLPGISNFPSTCCPSGSFPTFVVSERRPWSFDNTRPIASCNGVSSLLPFTDCLSSSSSVPQGYSISSCPVMPASVIQTAGRNLGPSFASTFPCSATNCTPVNLAALYPTEPSMPWTVNWDQPEGKQNISNLIHENSSASARAFC
eukprot:gi/632948184/ref/XP_007889452.1/ PREDICTED: spermatogenesis- and oogenesis-specific basic helix-loop-helix-containing protein 2 isoform X2 [Callorhinchus milii]